MALYADSERGRYPVWQSLDHPKFFPGSRIIFVTVTGDFANQRISSFHGGKVTPSSVAHTQIGHHRFSVNI